MLHSDPAPFPFAGSLAQLDGEVVTIRERLGDQALVFGPSITRRVPVAELAPPPEPDLFDRWLAERTIPARDRFQPRTLAAEVFADWSAWLEKAGYAATYPASEHAFERRMLLAGRGVTSGFWREPGSVTTRTRRLYPVALRSAVS
jgi:hypothetical protein